MRLTCAVTWTSSAVENRWLTCEVTAYKGWSVTKTTDFYAKLTEGEVNDDVVRSEVRGNIT